ncbi:MAG: hypothetical protein ACJAV1_000217 [Paraglaciecola sp.]|jgi:hypothetical protein
MLASTYFWRSLTLPLLALFAQRPVYFVIQYILTLALTLAFVLDWVFTLSY